MKSKEKAALLSFADVVAMTGVSGQTIRNWMAGGLMPQPIKQGKFLYWSRVEVEQGMKRVTFWRPMPKQHETVDQFGGGIVAGAGTANFVDMKASAEYTHQFHHNPLAQSGGQIT